MQPKEKATKNKNKSAQNKLVLKENNKKENSLRNKNYKTTIGINTLNKYPIGINIPKQISQSKYPKAINTYLRKSPIERNTYKKQ